MVDFDSRPLDERSTGELLQQLDRLLDTQDALRPFAPVIRRHLREHLLWMITEPPQAIAAWAAMREAELVNQQR